MKLSYLVYGAFSISALVSCKTNVAPQEKAEEKS
jgi:hypothetical protein